MKKYLLVLRMVIIIAVMLATSAYANVNTVSYHFQCTQLCQKKLQVVLEHFRQENQITGMAMSISLPDDNGGLQATQTFYSGSVEKNGQIPVGALNHEGKIINLMGIASITKSFTAAIALQLVAEGKLKLSDTVGMYLPQYPAWARVTIEQLLNMTAGVYDYEDGSPVFLNKLLANPYFQWSPDQVMQISYQNSQKTTTCPAGGNSCFLPGIGWYYSNADYMLLGMIIQQITGYSYEDELYLRLLGPTSKLHQLNDTYYASYPYIPSVVTRMVHEYDKDFPLNEQDTTFFNLSWDGPAGAIISNTEDIIRWVRLLFQTQEVLPKPQLKQLMQLVCANANNTQGMIVMFGKPIEQPDKNCSIGYGLGVMRIYTENNGLVWWYPGGDPGISSAYILYDKYNVVIALQYDNDADYGTLIDEIGNVLGIPSNIIPSSNNKNKVLSRSWSFQSKPASEQNR